MTILSDQKTGITPATSKAEYVKGLRAYADLLEAHPDLPSLFYGARSSESLVFFHGEDAVAQALAYIEAFTETPTIRVASDQNFPVRVVGRIHDLYFELCLKTGEVIGCGCECRRATASAIPAELRAVCAEQDGQVAS